jgi:calmodulin
VQSLELDDTGDRVASMIKAVDLNADGTIDFDEFIELMTRSVVGGGDEMMHAFKEFDKNGDGS